jgi:hypothetical protein
MFACYCVMQITLSNVGGEMGEGAIVVKDMNNEKPCVIFNS